MKEKMKGFLTSCYRKFAVLMGKFYSISRGKIVKSYARCREGEEGLRILLLYWCTVPAAIYIFVRFKVRLYAFLEWPVDLFIVILSVLDVFFIQKALKKHPEYDSEFVRNREKEKYYASLSGEELEKVKSSEKKENAKNFAKRLFLLDRSKRIDAYKIVRLFVLLTMLVALRRFLM